MDRIIRIKSNLLKKPVFEKENTNWILELQSVTKNKIIPTKAQEK